MRLLRVLSVVLPVGFSVSVVGEAAEPRGVHPEYLETVRAYADALIAHARDDYAEVKSPVFVAGGIDLKTKRFVRRQLKGQGIREGDRAYGANPHQDLNLYQVLYVLSEITGEEKYGREADRALRWFFQNCQSPKTQLLAWGEHLYWDVEAEACRGRDTHEFYRPWVLWERSFRLAPEACERFARGLWDHQIYNHSGDFNRHARWSEHGPGRRVNISRHAGFYIATWAYAYKLTQDPVYLKAIERVLLFKEASRHPVTNFLPSDRGANSVNSWLSDITGEDVQLKHDPRIGGLHSHVAGTLSLAMDLHEAAEHLGGELKQTVVDFSRTEDEHFLKFHEGLGADTEHLFLDLGGVSTMKAFAKGRAYCPTWDFHYGTATEAQVGMICFERYKQLPPGEVRDGYERLIRAGAERYFKNDPPVEAVTKPGVVGDVVLLLTAGYELSGEKRFLERAAEIADMGTRLFLDAGPLPRVAVGFDHYEAITRSDTMMMGILRLWQLLNDVQTSSRLVYTDR